MQIQITSTGDKVVMRLSGRFDFTTQRSFKMHYDPLLQQDAVKKLEVDLAGVDYMDSSALGMLMLLRERAQGVGHRSLQEGQRYLWA